MLSTSAGRWQTSLKGSIKAWDVATSSSNVSALSELLDMGFLCQHCGPPYFPRTHTHTNFCSCGSRRHLKDLKSCCYASNHEKKCSLIWAPRDSTSSHLACAMMASRRKLVVSFRRSVDVVVIGEEEQGALRMLWDDSDNVHVCSTVFAHCVLLPNTDNFHFEGFQQKICLFFLFHLACLALQQTCCLAASQSHWDAILLAYLCFSSLPLTPALFRFLLCKTGWHGY